MPPGRAPAPAAAAPSASDSFLVRLLVSMVSPGVQPEAIKVVYIALGGLIITGISLAAMTGGNIHVLVMLSLAFGLLVAFSWCASGSSFPLQSVRQSIRLPRSLIYSLRRFLANLKPAPAPVTFDEEDEAKGAKATKKANKGVKKRNVAPLAARAAPASSAAAAPKNEQREPEAQEIELPRTLGVAGNKGPVKAPVGGAGAGKAAAKKKAAPGAEAVQAAAADGWTVTVTKAQKQREKRKDKPQAAAAPAAAPDAAQAPAPAAAAEQAAQ